MQRFPDEYRALLTTIDAAGTVSAALARVCGASMLDTAGEDRRQPPLLLAAAADQAEERALADSVERGAGGLLLVDLPDWAAAERLSGRLSVVEARSGRADGSLELAVMLSAAGALLAALRTAPPLPRLTALGLDPAGLPPGSAATAQGLVLLAAASLGVPAFLRIRSTDGPAAHPSAVAAGFALALVDED